MKQYWFVFHKSDILLQKRDDGTYTVPCSTDAPTEIRPRMKVHNISSFKDGTPVKAYTVDSPIAEMSGYEMCGLRQSFYKLSHEQYVKAGKCHEIIYWDENTKFCGVCGSPMIMETDISKRCPKCGKEVWPQLATAIIVLIHRGDEVLLVHANNFKGNFYGLVAGFVETGETLEEAVYREVKEETGIEIEYPRYFQSQPWPYPSGLMVGFIAEYKSGTVRLQKSELGYGGWFHRNNLPEIPEKLSLARKLIDHWLDSFN